MKYCWTSIYNVFAKNLEDNKDNVKSKNQSWQDRVSSRGGAQNRKPGDGRRKSRPGDWRNIGHNSDCIYR